MHDPRLRGEHLFTQRSGGQDRVGVSALGRDHGAIDLVGAAVIEVRRGVGGDADQFAHGHGQLNREVAHVDGAPSAQNIDGLIDLEGVAYGPPEG